MRTSLIPAGRIWRSRLRSQGLCNARPSDQPFTDQDPVTRAAVDHRIEKLLDDTAARLIAGSRAQRDEFQAAPNNVQRAPE